MTLSQLKKYSQILKETDERTYNTRIYHSGDPGRDYYKEMKERFDILDKNGYMISRFEGMFYLWPTTMLMDAKRLKYEEKQAKKKKLKR